MIDRIEDKRIYNITKTRSIMETHGLELKKSLGQNFLVDGNILKKIVDAAELDSISRVLEVGPGIGSLTEEILLRGVDTLSIEIDQRFHPILEENFKGYDNFTLVKGDATDKDLFKSSAMGRDIFIANLPYVVTTPLLELIFTYGNFNRAIIMIQKEVAARILASPRSKDYSALSVFVKYFSDARLITNVKGTSFIPKPKVDSSVIRLDIKNNKDATQFLAVVHKAFGMRRKTLLNSLSMGLATSKEIIREVLLASNIDENRRAEELDLNEFQRLTDEIVKMKLL